MSYIQSLNWFKDFEIYDKNSQEILFMLSDNRYKFRYLQTLHDKLNIDKFVLESLLKNLESRGVLYIKQHPRTKALIVGLTQIQSVYPTALMVYTINGVIQDSFVVEYSKKNTDPLFSSYIRKNISKKFTDDDIEDILNRGYYKWKSNGSEHIINITNTKIIPA